MSKKSTTNLILETLVKASIVVLLLLGLAYIVFGKEFGMRREAQKTQERLVDSFIYVAKNWDKFDYSHRYGGKEKDKDKICEVPYEKVEPCGIVVDLPQDLSGFSKDVVPAMGDPKYIMYWDSYDNVESEAWSGWFWVDVILTVLPVGKLFKGLGIAGKVVFKLIPAAGIAPEGAKLVGKGITMLGKLVGFGKEELARGVKILLGKVEKEESQLTFKYLLAGDKNAAYNTIKEGFKKLAEESSGKEREIFEKAAKQIEEQEKIIKEQLENTKNVLIKIGREGKISILFPKEKDELEAVKYLKNFGNLPGDKATALIRLIKGNKIRFCTASGVLGGLILDEFKKRGIITQDEEGNYYYKGQPIEQEFLWIFGLTFANGILYTKVLKKVDKGFELKTVKLVDMSSKDMDKWVFYAYRYKEDGSVEEITLGTLKEIKQNSRLQKIKSLGTCIIGTGITFALTDFVHTYEAKYETVKGEARKCEKAICLKGQSMYPKSYKAKELMEVFEENKICGIKLLNVKRDLERYMNKLKIGGDIADFYLASPCFAYAQIWVADCKNPENPCRDDNLCDPWYSNSGKCDDYDEKTCCKRCIWVSLMKAKNLKFQQSSAFNYCAWSPAARISSQTFQTAPWPWAGYWNICPRLFGLENIGGVGVLCKLGEQMLMG